MKYNVYLKMVLDLPDLIDIEKRKQENETVDEYIAKEVDDTIHSLNCMIWEKEYVFLNIIDSVEVV